MIKGIAVIAIFYILSYFTGIAGEIITKRDGAKCSYAFRIAFGGCALLFTGMVCCFVLSAFKGPAVAGIIVSAVAVLVVIITAVAPKYKSKAGPVLYCNKIGQGKDLIYPAVFTITVAAQVAAVIVYRFDSAEVLRGVDSATAVFDTGRLYSADPMMLLIGTVSSVINVHPLLLVFTVAPVIFIPIYYLCYVAVIDTFVDGTRKRIAAFLGIVLLNIWGYQSDALIPVTLLLKWYGPGVYIVHGLLGIAAVLLSEHCKDRKRSRKEEYDEENEIPEEWDMKKHKIVNARNLAIALGVLAIALIVTVFVLNNKINRLYDATVNLQADMNNRCSIYEFAPQNGDTAGYLIKGSDGALVFVGGGSKDNAEELLSFFEKYGNNISKWYVYGEDEENAGAMRELTENDLVGADKVYIINASEMTQKQ